MTISNILQGPLNIRASAAVLHAHRMMPDQEGSSWLQCKKRRLHVHLQGGLEEAHLSHIVMNAWCAGDQHMIAVETCKRLGLGTNIMEGSELMTMEKHGNLKGLQNQVSRLKKQAGKRN